ncbi:hypothetical protein [Companilactobacillus sp.]|jgi:hypothetical protein|uniref:hypothetical protein n=1 Tax=Companilactobacillus sp. TaxID=2767905 RepID=UPI0025BA1395|nr:hypothetical protein [Companilactobacillus sp.]MCH4007949.1 hypothetical protein [Companilactobacillus sp.]MCH4051872.1 hypothetical protein [Companilactobacillus sp.]MCH4075892.1 hypothetical protein [Companilactobacillus sp.]MCH4124467.1 hypothetical protein [Companilactobacillus sp.]MCH4132570.1 hypothetical protein [Companilactobacillus sp.]
MKKTIVTLLAAVSLMGTATLATACSNAKTEQTEQHSASKITKAEIKNQYYVGTSKDNKNQYISFYNGTDKPIFHNRVSKDGSQKTISYYLKKPASKLVINKKDPKKFKIDGGMNIMAEPEFHYNFKKTGKTTIQSTENKQSWKLFDGSKKDVVKHAQNQAKNMKDAQ